MHPLRFLLLSLLYLWFLYIASELSLVTINKTFAVGCFLSIMLSFSILIEEETGFFQQAYIHGKEISE